MSSSRLFDPACYELANYFLDDCEKVTEAERKDLASTIQQAIEDWLEDRDTAADAAYDAYIDAQIDASKIRRGERRMGERA